MKIEIPELSLVIMIGASGSGKSTFARQWFKPSEIVSSDRCREIVSDDENNHNASDDAFELLYLIVTKRLKRGLLTVVDATNLRPEDRQRIVQIAREYHVLPTAIILNMPEGVCLKRNEDRADRMIKKHAIISQITLLKKGLGKLKYEGFRKQYEFRKPEDVAAVTAVERTPLWSDRKQEVGPFDIIGDIHGCYEELCQLLTQLGHEVDAALHRVQVRNGRKLVFLGDLVDRGPASPAVLKLVMQAVATEQALCVPGNHDMKLLKHLKGKSVQPTHGLDKTLAQLALEEEPFKAQLKTFLDELVSHYILDAGRLVVAHAGLKENMQGRGSGAVREFCLYGETTGETDEFGLPVRYNWAAGYKGKAMVVYGHTPVYTPQWFNNTIDIDTGCVFGGKLTALRYPEKELVSVTALKEYAVPGRPLVPLENEINLQQEHDNILNIADLLGKQQIETRLMPNITVREGNTAAALETMSRFGVNPKWLIYLPPTMSPAETSELPTYLEHPREAFAYYKSQGVQQVICEEKHMGSRAVVIVGKDAAAIKARFGVEDGRMGICYTRTGQAFFNNRQEEQAFLQMITDTLTARNFWTNFHTDWVCLDCELMPWSAKAQALLQRQYAATGAAAVHATGAAVATLMQAVANPEVTPLLKDYSERAAMSKAFVQAYRQYCWEVQSLSDYKLAPFHLLATEGHTYFDKDHQWHMERIAALCGGPMMATPYRIVDLEQEDSITAATNWWLALTEKGGEGMVVKPLSFVVKGEKGLVQPAIKIRGEAYLRIIYGPEYTREENLKRLKKRSLNAKRALALREFALGMEALESFVEKAPLRKIHRCVFGLLALESEAVDPRL